MMSFSMDLMNTCHHFDNISELDILVDSHFLQPKENLDGGCSGR